jgi:hypothetical protein
LGHDWNSLLESVPTCCHDVEKNPYHCMGDLSMPTIFGCGSVSDKIPLFQIENNLFHLFPALFYLLEKKGTTKRGQIYFPGSRQYMIVLIGNEYYLPVMAQLDDVARIAVCGSWHGLLLA